MSTAGSPSGILPTEAVSPRGLSSRDSSAYGPTAALWPYGPSPAPGRLALRFKVPPRQSTRCEFNGILSRHRHSDLFLPPYPWHSARRKRGNSIPLEPPPLSTSPLTSTTA